VSYEFRNLILASITFLLIAGCGGSAGNDGDSTPPVTGELVTITSNNATTVAGIVAQQVLEDDLFGALTTTGLPVVSAGSGAAIALSSLSAAPLPANMLAAQSTLQNCADGGTVDLTVSISNPLTISSGDEFGFEFDTCDNGTGTVLHGGLVINVSPRYEHGTQRVSGDAGRQRHRRNRHDQFRDRLDDAAGHDDYCIDDCTYHDSQWRNRVYVEHDNHHHYERRHGIGRGRHVVPDLESESRRRRNCKHIDQYAELG